MGATLQYEEIMGFAFAAQMGANLRSIVYYVDGLLIDTGHTHAARQVLSEVVDLPVDQMVVTHHHEDHSANIGLLEKHFDCPVYSSKLCVQLMKTARDDINYARRRSWGVSPIYRKLKVIGDVVQTKHHTFQVIPVPGHAEDMIALYEPDRKWLFSADVYLARRIQYFMTGESMAQQISSIKRLLELDFDALICSHNPVWEGGKARLSEKLDFLEQTFDRIQELHEQGLSIRSIQRQLNMKEHWVTRVLSGGNLSAKNIVRSVIRDLHSR